MIRAYLAKLAVWPGDEVVVHLRGDATGTASVVELLHSDPNPEGPGVLTLPCDWGSGTVSAAEVPTQQGSYASCQVALPTGAEFTLSLWILPTDLSEPATVASWNGPDGRVLLQLTAAGIEIVSPRATRRLASPVRERVWHFVGIAVGADGRSTPFVGPWGRNGGPFAETFPDVVARCADGRLLLGTRNGEGGDFDGRIAAVRVHHTALDIVDLMNVMNGFGPTALSQWSFGDRSNPDAVPKVGGGPPLALFNAPTWSADHPAPLENTGHALCGPGSIHLHRDDVEDCGWAVAARIRVPESATSGLYAVQITDGAQMQNLPFLVVGSAEVTLLIPTLTWQAYANLGRGPDWPGLSHYALHSDGSPCIISTSLKPSQTFAPSARLELDGSSALPSDNVTHLLMADLYAWYWLRGFCPDRIAVIDDRELHSASEVLSRTKVLVLSAHPEYWTEAMLDALRDYIGRGGSVIYLGGNGLYWVVSLHPSKPHLMEVRRWGGSQTWSVEPEDRTHQYESRLGGLWEDAGRPPNDLVGVGFAGFGAGPSLEFVRTPASYEPDWAWLFDGVQSARFGSHGVNSGACNEFDCFDPARPGPGTSTVLATSAATRPDHFGTFETKGGRAPSPTVRADLVGTVTPAGGNVLAVSSISSSGCLVSSADDGLRLVLENALRRMIG